MTARPSAWQASSGETELWLASELDPIPPRYNIVRLWRLEGNVDVARLRDVLDSLPVRHCALRTAYRWAAGLGLLAEHIAEPVRETPVETGAERFEIESWLHEQRQRVWDLSRGGLLQWALWHEEGRCTRLGLSAHHIVLDGDSLALLLREVGDLYAGGRALSAECPHAAPAAPRVDPDSALLSALVGAQQGLHSFLPLSEVEAVQLSESRFCEAAALRDAARSARCSPLAVLVAAVGYTAPPQEPAKAGVVGVPHRDRRTRLARSTVGNRVTLVPVVVARDARRAVQDSWTQLLSVSERPPASYAAIVAALRELGAQSAPVQTYVDLTTVAPALQLQGVRASEEGRSSGSLRFPVEWHFRIDGSEVRLLAMFGEDPSGAAETAMRAWADRARAVTLGAA